MSIVNNNLIEFEFKFELQHGLLQVKLPQIAVHALIQIGIPIGVLQLRQKVLLGLYILDILDIDWC